MEENPEEVVARLEAVAADSEGRITLRPAVTDAQMSSWPISVPDHIRAFFRRTGGFVVGEERHDFHFDHPDNHVPLVNEFWPLREPSASWILHSNGAATTYYVDVDPESGAWGRVFSFWEEPYVRLVAPSFLSWVDNLVAGARSALEAAGPAGLESAFRDWLYNGDDSLSRDPSATVVPLSVPEARASGDAELAEVAARLPDDAFLADLREADCPTEVPFAHVLPLGEVASYNCFHNGRFLAATVIPDV
ncbi:hypothetical protein GCM10023085_81250 [Actinomadura viridis]|uniref:SMI1/KNR4 family protein n=1 Tax=Actinomadura viridis TaxID=58110 RepID=A0A931DG03_9ACTN|nr:SMI1/KNR4 family protein [Actinomadura viridis]MBG6088104.1 hypothetical protein [Actinomadura viridis]